MSSHLEWRQMENGDGHRPDFAIPLLTRQPYSPPTMAVQEKEAPLPTFEEIIDDLCVYVQARTALT